MENIIIALVCQLSTVDIIMNLKSKIESLLFVSGNPFSSERIAKILGVKKDEAEQESKNLAAAYEAADGGMKIAVIDDKYQMVTNPECAAAVADFLKEEIIGELTRPQLETLTIVAYRGPISKFELEQIRGVNCSMILRNLLIRGLVEQKSSEGDMERFIITHDFLKYLGLTGTSELPDYEKLNADKNLQDLLERTKDA